MSNKSRHFRTGQGGFVPTARLLAVLTGCSSYPGGYYAGDQEGPARFVAQDDYVYYPGYNVYYSSRQHQYAYPDGDAWVSRRAPRDVSVDRLRASPSVKMDFHDSPAQHHAATVQKYPKNWSPSGSKPGQKQSRNTGQRGERAESNVG